jgi:hypothetical protein
MDMGVGSFVFSQGIVSAIPVIQFIKYPADLRPPLRSEIFSVLEKSLPVLALGLFRVVLVKGTQYPVGYLGLLPFRVGYAADDGCRNMSLNTAFTGTFS